MRISFTLDIERHREAPSAALEVDNVPAAEVERAGPQIIGFTIATSIPDEVEYEEDRASWVNY